MADDPQKHQNWWQTLPGILTGLASLIAALTGLIIVFYPKPDPNPGPKPTETLRPLSPSPLTGCVLTINANNIPLMSEPNLNSQQIASLIPGSYTSLDYRSINSYSVLKEGWFQIELEGRRGWIQDNTWIISNKSRACS